VILPIVADERKERVSHNQSFCQLWLTNHSVSPEMRRHHPVRSLCHLPLAICHLPLGMLL
ncbi:MAG: hypothetical protein J6X19_02265, partial [Clostridia bacterium]|nr:hypothetical protein [Clostridia bacterium]